MRIVAFAGPKYCGKDTAAKGLLLLNEAHKKNIFRRAPFAEGVKNVCKETFGYTDEHFEDPLLKETKTEFWPFIEPRWPLMDVANWFRDKYGGTVWVRRWERVAQASDGYWACHVITDHRFPEELEMLQRLDALIIYIRREEAEEQLRIKRDAGNAMALNISESHYGLILDNATHIVHNDSSIAHLHNEVQTIVKLKYGHWSHWNADKDFLTKVRTGEL